MSKKKQLIWLASLLGGVALVFLGGYGWILMARQPLNSPLARWLPWPVVCSTRGCITTWAWERQTRAAKVFASQTTEAITNADTLTTLVRQHLVHYAYLRSPVSVADARRYREEILKITSEEPVREKTGLSLADYDRLVILPLLEQESLRQQRKVETLEELFGGLAEERKLWVLPVGLVWDKEIAGVKRE